MIRMGHIEIDAGYVSAVSIPVWHLMSLEQKMPAIIVAFRRATGIMVQNEVSVFIRFSATAIAEISESRNHTRWVLEQIHALLDQVGSKFGRIGIVGDRDRIGFRHTAHFLVENPHVVCEGVEAATVASARVVYT